MAFEDSSTTEEIPLSKVETEEGFDTFVPEEFRADPFGYFEREGRNIKSGEVTLDEQGVIKEDPTATKDLPVWHDSQGAELHTVGKKVNTVKSQIGKSGDPFYEYLIMKIAREFDLPAPTPVAKAKRGNEHLIVMKKTEGIRWTNEGMRPILESGLTEADKQDLLHQAQLIMDTLQQKYEQIGLHRNWKLKDMIFDVDILNRKVLAVTPTDWERTKIDTSKLAVARATRLANS
ncbi:MAG: hypothetical protein WCW47_03605 [Candidatus Paceibacterota bacterium]|jgi:hypothetical protein